MAQGLQFSKSGVGIPRSIEYMFIGTLEDLEVLLEARLCGKLHASLWYALFSKRDARFFHNKERCKGEVWNLFYFYSSLWTSCTDAFRKVPLSILQLS